MIKTQILIITTAFGSVAAWKAAIKSVLDTGVQPPRTTCVNKPERMTYVRVLGTTKDGQHSATLHRGGIREQLGEDGLPIGNVVSDESLLWVVVRCHHEQKMANPRAIEVSGEDIEEVVVERIGLGAHQKETVVINDSEGKQIS